jgi:dienelactone hydrolase
MAALGFHVLCANSRYAKNDTALIMEKVIVDLGAYIRYAKEVWGYEKVVLAGWSGGGSLALFYQSQAENPTIVDTVTGEPLDIRGAGLIPADALVGHAAHLSRARLLRDWIDPSVRDELDPNDRELELDLYNPNNPHQPPYSAEFLERYRAAQLQRIRKISDWARETLDTLMSHKSPEIERGFITHRTMADPRFLDLSIDPNGRKPGWCFLGQPETVNSGPVGLGRFSTLRSWLSQWSIDDSRADGLACARYVSVPFLAVENQADDAVPQPHTQLLFDATASKDKTMKVIKGANHYYAGQPELLAEAAAQLSDWLSERQLR